MMMMMMMKQHCDNALQLSVFGQRNNLKAWTAPAAFSMADAPVANSCAHKAMRRLVNNACYSTCKICSDACGHPRDAQRVNLCA